MRPVVDAGGLFNYARQSGMIYHSAPDHPEGYALTISKTGIEISFRETGGLRAATATLRQLLREYGRRLPCLNIRDWPDFPRRGVMLDISRGRVPKLETLLDLAEHLADFKINELQLYTEHTFAYRKYKSVWQSWGALTGDEIRKLDARCRELGIDLVPNQNSFGHLRYFLEHPPLKKLAEISEPYEGASGDFLRRPTTLAPNHPGTLPFLRGLYDELLPNFSSQFFNVGCDETWDLGRGQSKKLCERHGKGRVYLDFLKKIHREVSEARPANDVLGRHHFASPGTHQRTSARHHRVELGLRSESSVREGSRDVCEIQSPLLRLPRHVHLDDADWPARQRLRQSALAAKAGKKFGAIGYLNTDWGDGGHPQPLAVSYRAVSDRARR